MLVDEIHWEINQTDPKRTIQVGSFRIMPDGSQRLSEVCQLAALESWHL